MSEDYMNHTWGCRCTDCRGVSCREEEEEEEVSHVPSCQCSECKEDEEVL